MYRISWLANNRGEELPEYAKNPDIILAADCVYLESAFPLLEQTLWDLTENAAPCFMAYKKRRKADSRFFKAMRKKFVLTEVSVVLCTSKDLVTNLLDSRP